MKLAPLLNLQLILQFVGGGNVYCESGQALSIYGDFCHDCQECPIQPFSHLYHLAMSTNCSKSSNHFCPIYMSASKICLDKVNVSITDYCSNGDEPWICPKANKGLNFEQCYKM